MKRLLSPGTNPNGWLAVIAAAYAITQAVLNAQAHHQPVNAAVIAAVLGAAGSFVARAYVTPVKDPQIPGGVVMPATAVAEADVKVINAVASWLKGEPPPSPSSPSVMVSQPGPTVTSSPIGIVQPPATTTGPVTPERTTP